MSNPVARPDPAARPGPAARTSRGRRPARPSADDREAAILATAERLLERRPLSQISIDDLARGAGISRPTFYFYFASKDAVLLALLDRVIEEADAAIVDVPERIRADPRVGWREAIDSFYRTFSAHRPVTLACAEVRATNAEVRKVWAGVLARWTRHTAEAIEAERTRGAAPPGLPAADLAIALNSMNERVLYGTFADDGPAVPERDVVDVLLSVWLAAIYGRAESPSTVD